MYMAMPAIRLSRYTGTRTASGNNHGREQRPDSGKDEAVDRDDDRRALQVLQLGVLDFAIHLGQRFLAAHGQDGVPERHEDAEEPERRRQARPAQEPERVRREMQVGGNGEGGSLA